MPAPTLPILPRLRDRVFILMALSFCTINGCSGGGDTDTGPGNGRGGIGPVDQVGPVVDAGPEFPITSSRLDVMVYAMRPGESLPADVMGLIRSESQSSPEQLKATLATRGFIGAVISETTLAELEHLLVSKPLTVPPPVSVPQPPPPPPRVSISDAPGTSIIGGQPNQPDQPAPEPQVAVTPVGSAVGNVSALSIRPGAAWIPLIDAKPRTEPWALSLGQSVASLKPGTLRFFVRNWPAPADPVPTAGMSAELRVQILPVVTGPLHEVPPDPLLPPPLSTDLSLRGQVLSRQAFTAGLRNGTALVLVAAPSSGGTSTSGPKAEAPPMLGQALLGAGLTTVPGEAASGPRVLVLKAVVPGTYRLMLDRPIDPLPPATDR